LHREVTAAGEKVSLATIYNALHQFKGAGLLREVAIDGTKSYFDTNVSNHSHFFFEDEGRLVDIDADNVTVSGLPAPPPETEISHIDIVVRVRRKTL